MPTGEQFWSADAGAHVDAPLVMTARWSVQESGGQSARDRVMSTIYAPRPIGLAGLARPLDGSPATGATDLVTATISNPHVLVVEDDRDTREVVKLILEMDGIGVIEAGDGLEGLERLHELRAQDPRLPCAIVLDIMMPRCSGEEFRRRQLADTMIADVPIIVLSAVADQPRVDTLDAFAKLSKPFDPDHLVRTVRRACGLHDH